MKGRRKADPTLVGPQQLSMVHAGDHVEMTLTVRGEACRLSVTVGPYHPTPPSNDLGHWYCVTHDEHFENQFQKDTHINAGTHQLAWICHEHGIEQPTNEEETHGTDS